MSALCVGKQWWQAVSAVETMLCESVIVDNATAGVAMKAYVNLGLEENWRSVSCLFPNDVFWQLPSLSFVFRTSSVVVGPLCVAV